MMAYLGAAMCALAAILVLRAERSEFAAFVGMAAAVILMGAAVSDFLPAAKALAEAASGTAFEGYFPTLLRALGITFAVELAAEVCRDAGESALASKVELAGKAQILLLSLPLIGELTSLAASILQA